MFFYFLFRSEGAFMHHRFHAVVVATFSVPFDAAEEKSVVSLTYSSLGRWSASGLHVVQPYITAFMILASNVRILSQSGEVDCSSSGRPYRLRRTSCRLANSTRMLASKVAVLT